MTDHTKPYQRNPYSAPYPAQYPPPLRDDAIMMAALERIEKTLARLERKIDELHASLHADD